MRKPCPECNLSGQAEYPGQLVSFTSAPIPCGCGDGFVDVPDPEPEECGDGNCDIPPRDVDMVMTLAPASDKAPVMWAAKLRKASEKSKENQAAFIAGFLDREEEVIPTGIDFVDKHVGGGFRRGINTFLGNRIMYTITARTCAPYVLVSSDTKLIQKHARFANQLAEGVRAGFITGTFEGLLEVVTTTTQKMVVVDEFRQYISSTCIQQLAQLHELQHACAKNNVVVVFCANKAQRLPGHGDIARVSNIVVERSGTGSHSMYKVHKSRWSAPGEEVAVDETKNDLTITISGEAGTGKSTLVDLISHALSEYGITANVLGEDRPADQIGSCPGKRIAAVAERSNITITHQQTKRRSAETSNETIHQKTTKDTP